MINLVLINYLYQLGDLIDLMLDAIKDELENDQEHVENNEHGQFEKDAKLHSLLPPNKKGLLRQNFLCLRWKVPSDT